MADVVSIERVGPIGLIALDNPPVNAAGHGLRAGLVEAVETLEAEDGIAVIGLYGAGRTFIAGADIREFGKPPRDPWLPEVCNRLESCAKPIVSVLHGAALGGGLEVAMATHARVAVPGVRLGLPEVTLGILPGAGGTQRTPRLVGVKAALELATTGKHIGAEEALELGLVDRVMAGEPRNIALAAAEDLAAGVLAHRRTGQLETPPDPGAIDAAKTHLAKTQSHLFAPHRVVEAIAAATLPLSDGLAEERRLFNACMDSPERAGLIHAFFAERAVARIPEGKAAPREVAKIGVIGGGTMGSGIATACLLAGYQVVLVDVDATSLDRGISAISSNLDGAVARGKMAQAARDAVDLTPATDLSALSGADLIIEAAFEDMAVKRDIFGTLGQVAKPGAVLATNTSYLDLDQIAAASGRADDVVGLHFFSPAHVMRLVEVVVGAGTAPEVVATGFALARRLKKIAVRSGVCDGFIGNRVMQRYRQAADHLMLDGAMPDRIDAAIRGFGFAMGPFEVSDLAGLDIAWAQRKRLAATRDPAERYGGGVADALCEAGELGRKAGMGFYDHSGDAPVPNPRLGDLIANEQARLGIAPRAITEDEIVNRYMTAMIMEAARVVEDGIALRPIDVDAVFLFGYGFPRWKGGPLHHADTLGASEIVARIETHAKSDPQFWRVPDILAEMARNGRRFADMNKET